jgi:hypothetical protein
MRRDVNLSGISLTTNGQLAHVLPFGSWWLWGCVDEGCFHFLRNFATPMFLPIIQKDKPTKGEEDERFHPKSARSG